MTELPEFVRVETERLATELSARGLDWADKEAAASALEETRKSVLAGLKTEHPGSDANREMLALADKTYTDFVRAMVEARKEANKAKVRYDTYRVYIELTRSKVATERAAMSMR